MENWNELNENRMFLLFKESERIITDKIVHAIKDRKVIIIGVKFSDHNKIIVLIKDKNIWGVISKRKSFSPSPQKKKPLKKPRKSSGKFKQEINTNAQHYK